MVDLQVMNITVRPSLVGLIVSKPSTKVIYYHQFVQICFMNEKYN